MSIAGKVRGLLLIAWVSVISECSLGRNRGTSYIVGSKVEPSDNEVRQDYEGAIIFNSLGISDSYGPAGISSGGIVDNDNNNNNNNKNSNNNNGNVNDGSNDSSRNSGENNNNNSNGYDGNNSSQPSGNGYIKGQASDNGSGENGNAGQSNANNNNNNNNNDYRATESGNNGAGTLLDQPMVLPIQRLASQSGAAAAGVSGLAEQLIVSVGAAPSPEMAKMPSVDSVSGEGSGGVALPLPILAGMAALGPQLAAGVGVAGASMQPVSSPVANLGLAERGAESAGPEAPTCGGAEDMQQLVQILLRYASGGSGNTAPGTGSLDAEVSALLGRSLSWK